MKILIGVCGGIAAYKAADLVSKLVQNNHEVNVCMTPNAENFISALTFTGLTGNFTQTLKNLNSEDTDNVYSHLFPASISDIFVLIPATANTIASIANGYGNDPVSNSALSLPSTCRKIFCPAMNPIMWEQSSVQRNVNQLKNDGWKMIDPETGRLACGSTGIGRLANLDTILEVINRSND